MHREPSRGSSTEKPGEPIVSPAIAPTSSGLMKLDWLIALVFLAVGLSAVLLVKGAWGTAIDEKTMTYRWFESDSPLVLENMSDRFSDSSVKVKLHPLFPLLTYPLVSAITRISKLSPLEAAWLLNAASAGVWLGALYLIMRLLGCRLLDSTLFTSLAASSGAAMFWFIVPETYPLSSLTVLLALGLVALARHRPVPDWWFVVASALSLGLNLLNWVAGLIAAFVCKPPRRAVALSLIALAIVVGLLLVEKISFPGASSWFISPRGYDRHKIYLLCEEQGGPQNAARVIFLTSMVLPRIELSTLPGQQGPTGPMLTLQRSPAGSSGVLGQVTTITWALLLFAGAWALFAGRADVRFRIALAVTLLAESAVYLVYGDETFVYALNYMPLLILLASLSTLSRWRYWVVAALGLLLPCTAWNNACQLREALDIPARAAPSGAGPGPPALTPAPIGEAGVETGRSVRAFQSPDRSSGFPEHAGDDSMQQVRDRWMNK